MTQTMTVQEYRHKMGIAQPAPTPKARPQAKGRLPKNSFIGYDVERMNGLESRYAGVLEAQRRAGQIVFWKFGEMKLRLADKTWYNLDFYILYPDGHIEIHETKGFMRDDANVKIKAAAEKFPEFKFVLVQWIKGQWKLTDYKAGVA